MTEDYDPADLAVLAAVLNEPVERHCIECGNATGLVLVALPVCPDCYVPETRDEHFEHLRREDDQAMARRMHPAGSSPRRRARERWFPNEFLGRSGE